MSKKETAPATSANVAKGPKGKVESQRIHSLTSNNKLSVELTDAPQRLPWAAPYMIGKEGVYKVTIDEKTQTEEVVWIFSPLLVLARTRDQDDQNWGLLLQVQTPSKKWHQWSMPMSLMSTSTYREILLSMGLQIEHWAQKDLQRYLLSANPQQFVTCVQKVGWYDRTYVLPDAHYGPQGKEPIILQSSTPINIYRVKGTLEEWQENIGRFCVGNSRLAFSVSVAFAAIMLKIIGMNGAGFHIVGMSSTGKSTALTVAASVCGGGGENGFVRRWRTTGNALESWALAHNHNLLPLDEISQVSAKEAAEIAYMLANGQGKGRAGKDGIARQTAEWRLFFLSNGEISLEQKLKENGQRYMAGHGVRVIHVPADTHKGYGIFEELHGFADGKALSEYLQEQSSKFHGAPLRKFLEQVCFDLNSHKDFVNNLIVKFENECCPQQASEQVRRTAKYFALVAASGELAIKFGVLPWDSGNSIKAARRCMLDWIAFRGGLDAAEVREAAYRVRDFISRHGTSRFYPLEAATDRVVLNCAGYRKEGRDEEDMLFLITPTVFRDEICVGGDYKNIARFLIEAGYLKKRADGRHCQNHKIPGISKSLPFYTVSASILAEEDG